MEREILKGRRFLCSRTRIKCRFFKEQENLGFHSKNGKGVFTGFLIRGEISEGDSRSPAVIFETGSAVNVSGKEESGRKTGQIAGVSVDPAKWAATTVKEPKKSSQKLSKRLIPPSLHQNLLLKRKKRVTFI